MKFLKVSIVILMLISPILTFDILDTDTGIQDFIKNNKIMTVFIVVALILIELLAWGIIESIKFN